MQRIAALIIAFVAVPVVAHADVEIGGIAGAHIFSDTNGIGVDKSPTAYSEANSALFGLRLGVYFGEHLGVEAEGAYLPNESRMLLFDVNNILYRGQLVYRFQNGPSSVFVPFVLAGGGVMQIIKTDNDILIHKGHEGMGYIGAGAMYRAQGDWGIRGDLRAILVPSSGTSSVTLDYEVVFSLNKVFGRAHPPKHIATPPPPKDEDPDHDGVLGDNDKCPNEAGPAENNGCPDKDTDGDGIIDRLDKCPNEAGPAENGGCPDKDTDGDGIVDRLDKCPNDPETKNGYQDEDGCPDEIPEKVKQFTGAIQGITFKLGSADLAPQSNAILDKAVAVLGEFKDVKLEIQGHTDDQPLGKGGKFADNIALSQARADSVKAYFVKKGIDESRLISKGYGDTLPVDDPKALTGGKLNAARAKNRRVEFKLIMGTAPAAPAPAPAAPAPAAPAPAPAPAAPAG